MFRVSLVPTAEQFREKAFSWLSSKEVQNNLVLGILANLLRKPTAERQEHYFWMVEDGESLKGAAYWTPPFNFTVTEMEKDALEALVEEVAPAFPLIPGIGGPRPQAEALANLWCIKTRKTLSMESDMRLYQLKEVQKTPMARGVLQNAREKDKGLWMDWLREFHRQVHLHQTVDEKVMVENYVAEKRLFTWDDGGFRSMGGFVDIAPNGARVNMVYTPEEFRGKGYATSLVAALSQKLLDSGKKFCCLYTDLLNPTSNSIYQKIGYRPLCDWANYRFGAPEGTP